MPDEISFMVNGTAHTLSRAAVSAALRGVTPEPIRAHGVIVDGTAFPVKQAFAVATRIDRLDFTSAVARRKFQQLGYALVREEEAS